MFIRQSLIAGTSAALLAASLLVSAADDLDFSVSTNPITFAEEIFGVGSNNRFLGRGGGTSGKDELSGSMSVTLTIRESTGLSQGARGELTFWLTDNLRFGNAAQYADFADQEEYGMPAVGPSNLVFAEADSDGAVLSITVARGGAVNDSFVTYQLTATNAGDSADGLVLEGGDTLTFNIPAVWNVGGLGGINSVSVGVRTTREGSNLAVVEGGANFRAAEYDNTASQEVLRTANRFTVRAQKGNDATVDSSDLTALSNGGVPVVLYGNDLNGVVIGRVGFEEHEGVKGRRGVLDHQLLGEDMFSISINGAFEAGDRVFVDANSNFRMDPFEQISISDGVRSFGGWTDHRYRLEGTLKDVILVTAQNWRPGSFSVGFALNFDKDINIDESSVGGGTLVSLMNDNANLMTAGSVYGVPSCIFSDRIQVRVTNESDIATGLWMQGYDENGTPFPLTQLDASVPRLSGGALINARETIVLNTEHFEQALGFNRGNFSLGLSCNVTQTWEGRAQFTFLSTGSVEIVPLVRTADGLILPWANTDGM